MAIRRWCGLVAGTLLVLSCFPRAGAERGPPAPVSVRTSGPLVPGTYTTRPPHGGAFGDELFLTLLPNHTFSLRQTYRDRRRATQETVLVLGRWTQTPDGCQVTLEGGPPWLRRLDVIDQGTLRMVSLPDRTPLETDRYQSPQRVGLVPFLEPFKLRGLLATSLHSQP
jgi:hypothetical protein